MKKLSILALGLFALLSSAMAQVQLESMEEKAATQAQTNYPMPKPLKHFKAEPITENNDIKYVCDAKFKRTIYVDAQNGKDSNKGTSESKAIKSLDKLAKMNISFGDRILLRGGQTHAGTIELINLNEAKPATAKIHISSYGGEKATIDFKGYPAGVWIQNTSNVIVSDLKMTGDGGPDNKTWMIRPNEKNNKQRFAVRILSDNSSPYSMRDLVVYNIDVNDVYLPNPMPISRACRQWDMNDQAGWGWGVFGEVFKGGQGIQNVDVKYVNVSNVGQMGIRFKGSGSIKGGTKGNVDSVRIEHCTIYKSGGPGMQFNRCNNSHMKYCRISESGDRNDNRKWGRGSGMWTWGVNNFLLEYNIFEGAQGIADCCGAHIDFNCSNVVIQNCLSRFNAGGFIEVLGLNYNCAYRFNVSFNDGWRNIKDPAQSFWGKVGTPGHVVTVNGHNNEKGYRGPYQTYIYNNTIITTVDGMMPYKSPNVFNISTSNEGLLMMNNIFWFEEDTNAGWSMHRWKDGKAYDAAFDFKISASPKPNTKVDKKLGNSFPANVRAMNKAELDKMDLVMRNNLYRRFNKDGKTKYEKVANALPDGYWDDKARGGFPQFVNFNSWEAAGAVPKNATLINSGEEVKKLKSDKSEQGIHFGGLKVTTDFFGNPIEGNIIGAIVPNAKIRDWKHIYEANK